VASTILFHFSGTGNSLAVARLLADRLEDARIVSMLRSDAPSAIDASTRTVGLIYPIHMNQVPRVVASFLDRLKLPDGVYVFAVPTHGGLPGHGPTHLRLVCERRGVPLNACFPIEMVNNTPKGVAPKLLMRLDWERDLATGKLEVALRGADVSTEALVPRIMNRESTNFRGLISGRKRLGYWMMRLVWWMGSLSRPKLTFELDNGACSGCGLCAHVCTTGRIRMEGSLPSWVGEDCNYCYACFNFCPAQAIGVKHYVKKLGRYHHPRVTAEDIAAMKPGSGGRAETGNP